MNPIKSSTVKRLLDTTPMSLIFSTYADASDPALSQLIRHVRRAPFLAGALVGAGIANNHHPSHYHPPTYYPSSGYHNGYYYSG